MKLKNRRGVLYFSLLLTIALFTSPLKAAPFEIEGFIKQIRTIDVKEPYAFGNKPVVSIYIVGKRFGKDFDYQYMIIKDSTKLEGFSFSDIKVGMYVRVKGRAEPACMVGKPLQEIRASRYGCCNYALHVDTICTPRSINAVITRVDSYGPTDIVITVRKNKKDARSYKYLIVDGKSTFTKGSFSEIKVSAKIKILQADINVPVAEGKDHGKLHGADLYAPIVYIK